MNELKIEYPKKKDTLGIPRDEMPQVKSAHFDELIDFFKQHGIRIERKTVPAKTLRATQENFNIEKIMAAIEKYFTLSTAKPIIVSSDNYVIDGHHRWLAALNVGGDIDIMQANVRVEDLLSAIRKFPKTFTKDINQT